VSPAAPGRDLPVAELAEGVRTGDRRALARAVTLVESTRRDHRGQAEELLDLLLPHTGGAIRIGISGPPGVGKSTFIEAFGLHVLGDGTGEHGGAGGGPADGHRLAVLAIDPTSSRSGGAILGDKTRMVALARHPGAFIRPSPGGGQLGGVARRTREVLLLCEAAGFDVVLVETIGVGQSEVAVADLTDLFLVLVNPGGGDELQGIKRGIMELADLVVVTKSDGDLAAAAGRTEADYRSALHLLRPKWRSWTASVLKCSSLTGSGVDGVWEAVEAFRAAVGASGELDLVRAQQAVAWMWSELSDELGQRFRAHDAVRRRLPGLERQVAAGELAPASAARQLLDRYETR
jgi:LAO/AO transport system kinase